MGEAGVTDHNAEVIAAIKAYARANDLTLAKLSLKLGKSHTWISEMCTGRKGAHLGVLAMQDRIDFSPEVIEWASIVRAEKMRISAMAPRRMAKCPVAADAHWWHGVKLYPLAAQSWR